MKICAISAFYRLPLANNLLPLKTYSSINSIMDFILEMHFDIKHFIEMIKAIATVSQPMLLRKLL